MCIEQIFVRFHRKRYACREAFVFLPAIRQVWPVFLHHHIDTVLHYTRSESVLAEAAVFPPIFTSVWSLEESSAVVHLGPLIKAQVKSHVLMVGMLPSQLQALTCPSLP